MLPLSCAENICIVKIKLERAQSLSSVLNLSVHDMMNHRTVFRISHVNDNQFDLNEMCVQGVACFSIIEAAN